MNIILVYLHADMPMCRTF